MGHTVYCKWLRNDGLHTFLGMVGYCMKKNGEEHLEFVHLHVLVEDMNDDKMEYAKFGKVDLKACVLFSSQHLAMQPPMGAILYEISHWE